MTRAGGRPTMRDRAGSSRGDVSFLARAEWRARWRSHFLLTVVTAATLAVVLATLIGASRSESAFHRLRRATGAADLVVYPEGNPFQFAKIFRGRAGVEAVAVAGEVWVRPRGSLHFPGYDLLAIAPLGKQSRTVMNAPVIVSGRQVDPTHAHEIAINESLADELGVTVGQMITFDTMTERWADASNKGPPGPPDGPRVKLTVVGLARSPADFGHWKAIIHLSPAFAAQYEKQIYVRPAVQARMSRAARQAAEAGTFSGLDRDADYGPSSFGDDAATGNGLATVATALRLVAAAAALSGAVAATMLLARLTALAMVERSLLVSLGATRRRLSAAVALMFTPWLLAGVATGVVAGVVASRFATVSLARSVDPTPDAIIVDLRVLAVAVAAAIVLTAGVLAVLARRAASPRQARARAARRGVPLRGPMAGVLGVRYALSGDAAGGGRTSRGALVAVAVAVAAAVAALGVSASIARLERDPSLIGQATSRVIDSGESTAVYDRGLPLLEHDRRVAMLTGVHVAFSISTAAGDDLTALVHDRRRGDFRMSVLRGRIARESDEVALGPATLEHLGKQVGQTIELRAEKKAGAFRIVGSVLFPEGDFPHDDGIALTGGGADRLLGNVHDASELHQIAFDWKEGVDAAAADKSLAAIGLPVLTSAVALKPASVTNLGRVEALPRFMALFFGFLGLLILGQAILVTTRLRAREFATLRALGTTPGAIALVVASYAATILAIALALGVLIGLGVERQVWRPIADGAHVIVRAEAPWVSIAVLLTSAVVLGGVITAVPAWRARRVQPARILHAE